MKKFLVAMSATLIVLSVSLSTLACGDSGSSPAIRSTANLKPIEFALDWSGPEYIGFYVAQTMGYYADHGLNVTLLPGAGSAAAAQGILDGSNLFGTVSANAIIRELIDNSGQSGPSADSVPYIPAVIFPESPSVIVTRKDRKISTVQDLVGLKIGYTSEVAEAYRQFRELLGLNPGLEAQMTLSEFLFDGPGQLQTGAIDALINYMMDVPPGLEMDGFEYNATPLSELGLEVPSQCIFVGRGSQIDAETVQSFIQASCEGWEYVRRNPETAAKLYDKMLPGQNVEKIEIIARHSANLLPPPNSSNMIEPYTDPAQLLQGIRRCVDIIVDARGLNWSEEQRGALVANLTAPIEAAADPESVSPAANP